MICGSGGSKSRLAKAADAEPSGGARDEKMHGSVAQSAFRSQNAQSAPCSDHFWKLRCQKVHSIVARADGPGPLLEVELLKKCATLWREAHAEVKIYKTPQLRSIFGS